MTGYAVSLSTVGGVNIVPGIDVQTSAFNLEWSNLKNIGQSATITFGPGCCDSMLHLIEPLGHEMAVYRGNDQVVVGPVVNKQVADDLVTVTVQSLNFWNAGNPVRQGAGPGSLVPTPSGLIPVSQLVDDYYQSTYGTAAPFDFANILPFLQVDPCPVDVERSPLYDDTLGSQLENVVGSILDFVAYGRQIRYWCRGVCLPGLNTVEIPPFAIRNRPVLEQDASDVVTRAVVRDSNNPPTFIGLADASPAVGFVWQVTTTDDSNTAGVSANTSAAAQIQQNARWQSSEDEQRVELTCEWADQYPLSRIIPGMCCNLNVPGCVDFTISGQITGVGATWANGVETPWISFSQLPEQTV